MQQIKIIRKGESMSRPLLRTNELRRRVDCYFNKLELEQLQSKARESGLPLSAYIRRASLGSKIHALPPINAIAWHELSHTTANLNQIAKHLNSGLAYGIEPKLIEKLANEVRQLRLDLVGANE